MKVMALIYGDEARWESLGEDERQAVYARYRAFGERSGNKVLDGAELASTRSATTVRVRDGETVVTDGPFAETKEVVGGYFLVDCKDLDQAIELAQRVPLVGKGSVEIRPVVTD